MNFMQNALDAAQQVSGSTWPNPAVGCIITDAKNTKIIAHGCTCKGGRPHAETVAIANAGTLAAGATCYVTLEPCNHTSPGKPLSCTDAIIGAGISRVVIALPDPDPRMAGKSIAKLKAAGLDVVVGTMAAQAIESHRGHIMRTLKNRPFITLKLAVSSDGKMGLPGVRTPISGPESWARTYALRGFAGAVMVGSGTALADNPQLTNRNPEAPHQPVRIVLDTNASLPANSALAGTLGQAPLWLVTAGQTHPLEGCGARTVRCAPAPAGGLDIHAVLAALYHEGLAHILVEGGAKLAQTLIAAQLVDEAFVITAQTAMGQGGIPAPPLSGLTKTGETAIGADIWHHYVSKDWHKIKEKLLNGL